MNQRQKLMIVGLLVAVYVMYVASLVQGQPVGATVLFNESTTASSSAASRADEGGVIVTLRLDATQQNFAWKAYVGNISGTLVLDNAAGESIYGWSLATLTGEVLATRASSPTWTALSCATNATIATEQSYLTMSISDIDSINHTFNETTHQAFTVAGNTLSANTCRVAYTYINDSSQAPSATNLFQEILINDTSGNIIYVTELEQDIQGYDSSSNFDFQFIVPDNDEAGNQTTYYFYVELDSS